MENAVILEPDLHTGEEVLREAGADELDKLLLLAEALERTVEKLSVSKVSKRRRRTGNRREGRYTL